MRTALMVLAVVALVVVLLSPLVAGAWLIGDQFGWRTGLAVFLLVAWLKDWKGD